MIALANVLHLGDHSQVVRNMKAADILAVDRHDVIDLKLDARALSHASGNQEEHRYLFCSFWIV